MLHYVSNWFKRPVETNPWKILLAKIPKETPYINPHKAVSIELKPNYISLDGCLTMLQSASEAYVKTGRWTLHQPTNRNRTIVNLNDWLEEGSYNGSSKSTEHLKNILTYVADIYEEAPLTYKEKMTGKLSKYYSDIELYIDTIRGYV